MLIKKQNVLKFSALAFLLSLAPSASAEFGEHALSPVSTQLPVYQLVPKRYGEDLQPDRRPIEDILVTAPRTETLRTQVKRFVAGLLTDEPGGLDLELFPVFQPEELVALEAQYIDERLFHQRMEPIGGFQLFRITLNRQ